jgi:hypothetical protein
MGLHRDIHWLGKQWAVTGFGMQAIDKKLGGKFDIEIARLWEEGLADWVREQHWFNREDFEKALAMARRRYQARSGEAPLAALNSPERAEPAKVEPAKSAAIVLPQLQPPAFRIEAPGRAKFVRPWRVWVKP